MAVTSPPGDRPDPTPGNRPDPANRAGAGANGAGAGAAMFAHLQEVHALFRGQLAALRVAVDRWAQGSAVPADVLAAAGAFTPAAAGRDVRTHCLYYCQALTLHHSIEDTRMFPAMRAAAPEAVALFDRLEAEHHVVAEILAELTELVSSVDNGGTAHAVGVRLRRLSDELETHLAFEEEVLQPLFGP